MKKQVKSERKKQTWWRITEEDVLESVQSIGDDSTHITIRDPVEGLRRVAKYQTRYPYKLEYALDRTELVKRRLRDLEEAVAQRKRSLEDGQRQLKADHDGLQEACKKLRSFKKKNGLR